MVCVFDLPSGGIVTLNDATRVGCAQKLIGTLQRKSVCPVGHDLLSFNGRMSAAKCAQVWEVYTYFRVFIFRLCDCCRRSSVHTCDVESCAIFVVVPDHYEMYLQAVETIRVNDCKGSAVALLIAGLAFGK